MKSKNERKIKIYIKSLKQSSLFNIHSAKALIMSGIVFILFI